MSTKGRTDDGSPTTEWTADQLATVRAAVRQGYFEVPRRGTLVEVAGVRGISDQEASVQLRRAIGSMVRAQVDVDGPRRG